MDKQNYASRSARSIPDIDGGLRAHMTDVYSTMTIGMIITAAAAWAVSGLSMTTVDGTRQLTEFGNLMFNTPLKWVVAFAPLVLIFMGGAAMKRMSSAGLRTAFYAVAALIGVSMATLLIAFTGASVATAFFATAAGFAGLSLFGYTTQKDMSGMGSFFMMGVIGLIVVMIANIFIQSSAVALSISVVGVLLFAGLTAYDTQRAKTQYLEMRSARVSDDDISKFATLSALNLYLDFVNMFQFLLNLLGARNN